MAGRTSLIWRCGRGVDGEDVYTWDGEHGGTWVGQSVLARADADTRF